MGSVQFKDTFFYLTIGLLQAIWVWSSFVRTGYIFRDQSTSSSSGMHLMCRTSIPGCYSRKERIREITSSCSTIPLLFLRRTPPPSSASSMAGVRWSLGCPRILKILVLQAVLQRRFRWVCMNIGDSTLGSKLMCASINTGKSLLVRAVACQSGRRKIPKQIVAKFKTVS